MDPSAHESLWIFILFYYISETETTYLVVKLLF